MTRHILTPFIYPYLSLLLLIVASHLLLLFLYLADRMCGNRPQHLTASYYLRAFITAVVFLAVLIAVRWAVGRYDIVFIRETAPVAGFVVASYVVRTVQMKDTSFDKAVWVSLIAWVAIYAVDALLWAFLDMRLWPGSFKW